MSEVKDRKAYKLLTVSLVECKPGHLRNPTSWRIFTAQFHRELGGAYWTIVSNSDISSSYFSDNTVCACYTAKAVWLPKVPRKRWRTAIALRSAQWPFRNLAHNSFQILSNVIYDLRIRKHLPPVFYENNIKLFFLH